MKKTAIVVINILGILAVLTGVLLITIYLFNYNESLFYRGFAIVLGGVMLPDPLIAFFEGDEEEDEDE